MTQHQTPERSFLQPAGVTWLRRWVPPPGIVWSVEYPRNHAGKKGDTRGAMFAGTKLKARGISAGIPDTWVLRLDRVWAIEWKYSTDPTEDQITFANTLRANGHHWCACWSVMDAYKYLAPHWGLGIMAEMHAEELDGKWRARVNGLVKAPSAATRARKQTYSARTTAMRARLNEPIPDLTGGQK